MVNDADWHDLDGDGTKELIVAGEWMPISIFVNAGGKLSNETESYFEKPYSGLWNTILVEDLNHDGVPDLVAGNLGLNAQIKASEDQPAELYFADFNNDGSVDPILSLYIQGNRYPFVTLDELRKQMPRIGSRFSSYAAYGEVKIEDLFSDKRLETAEKLEATLLETSLFIGQKNGRYEKQPLPIEAQFSPVFTIHTLDYNGDDITDLILGGNIDEARIRFGKYDANYGMLLKGSNKGSEKGKGNTSYAYIPQHEAGLHIRGDIRSIIEIDDQLLFGINRGRIQSYKLAGE